jgi:hypothetical protein
MAFSFPVQVLGWQLYCRLLLSLQSRERQRNCRPNSHGE